MPEIEFDAKTLATIYIIGALLSFVMTGINSLISLTGFKFGWSTPPAILLSALAFPFAYGTIIHLIDNFLMGEHLDFEKRILIPIWIVGVVISFIMLIVNSVLELFGITLDWSTLGNILVALLVFPWVYGFFAHEIDNRITEK